MTLVSKLIAYLNRKSARRFDVAAADTRAAQLEMLMAIVRRNAGTEYGKRYGFDAIDGPEDFRRHVPVVTYEDIRKDMDRVVNGVRKVLTAEDPVMFAQTSGTTGQPKFIPVTPTDRSQAHHDVVRTWLYHMQRDHPDMFSGRVVSLVSPAVEGHTPGGAPYGSTSGHVYKSQPRLVRRVYSVPYVGFEIADYIARYYVIMRTSIADDVRFVATANPSSVLKMCEKANEFSEDIIRDVRDGTLSQSIDVEPEIRAEIEGTLRANPAAARRLEDARWRRDGVLKPGDYWPRVGVIGCWKGGTVNHYIERFDGWFDPDGRGSVPVRDLGYLASECRGSIPMSDEGSAGALAVGSSFFEFVEVEALEQQPDDPHSWPALTADQVEDGGEYYILVTTTSGLYRYDINDVVRVVGRYRSAPQIEFVRKGRGMTNITGEKLSVNQVIEAMQSVSRVTGALPDHFKAEADPANSRYLFRVEFSNAVDPVVRRAFLAGLDEHLKKVNIEYKAKRDSRRLGAPVLHVMREGWYERQRREQVSQGRRAFQAKTELLSATKQATTQVRPDLVDVVELGE